MYEVTDNQAQGTLFSGYMYVMYKVAHRLGPLADHADPNQNAPFGTVLSGSVCTVCPIELSI